MYQECRLKPRPKATWNPDVNTVGNLLSMEYAWEKQKLRFWLQSVTVTATIVRRARKFTGSFSVSFPLFDPSFPFSSGFPFCCWAVLVLFYGFFAILVLAPLAPAKAVTIHIPLGGGAGAPGLGTVWA